MKTLTALLTTVLVVSCMQAQQNTFQNAYVNGDANEGMNVCQTSDGGYLVCGAHTYKNQATGLTEYHPVFLKTDSVGTAQYMKQPVMNFCPTNITKTPDGGYLVYGGPRTTNTKVASGGMLLKLDANGDSAWTKCIANISVSSASFSRNFLIPTNDGNYFVAGYSLQNMNNIYFTKITPAGDVIMGDTLQKEDLEEVFCGKLSLDGGLIVAIGDSASFNLVKLASDGSRQWAKQIASPYSDIDGIGICLTSDGGYLIRTGSKNNPSERFLTRTNANGDTLWTRNYISPAAVVQYGSLKQTADGGFISFSSTGTINSASSVEKFDANGSFLWEKRYHNTTSSKDVFYAGMLASDGGLLLCGSTRPGNSTASEGLFLIKTNADGNWTNTISGNVFMDANHNCTLDGSEITLPNQLVKLTPGPLYTNTDDNGNYVFHVPAGNYTVSLVNSNYTAVSCPASGNYSVQFPSLGGCTAQLNFADTVVSSCPDLMVNIGTCGLSSCYQNTYTINYSNHGAVADTNALVTLTPENAIVFLNSSIPWVFTAPNSYTFSVGMVMPGQSGSFTVTDSVSCTATVGSTQCVAARIFSTMQECDTLNNKASDCEVITSSLDPNELLVSGSQVQKSAFTAQNIITNADTLNYFVRFENTGTGAAVNIVVTDTLSSYLDAASFTLGATSNACTYSINDKGILTCSFQNIMLPDSGHDAVGSTGFFRFRIAQKHNNPAGTEIKNRASIVFDFNAPVATNATLSMIPLVTGIQEQEANNSNLNVFPNPSNGSNLSLTLNGEPSDKKVLVVVYDMEGKSTYSKVIITGQTPNNLVAIDPTSKLAAGVYVVVATSDNRIYKQRIVIE